MTVHPRAILAIDLGTSGPKVALVTPEGTVLDHAFAPVEVLLTPDGGAEQDPDAWWSGIARCSRELMARSGHPDLLAVAVTSQWMGTVPVGADGRHLHNALIWMDARGAEHSQELTGGGVQVPGTGYNARKLARWLRYTGGLPSRTGKDPVGHIAWLRAARPEIHEKTHVYLEPADHLNLRLTGRPVASADMITGFWCTDNRDLAQVRYVDGLVQACGLRRDQLPDLVPTGTVIGEVTSQAAADLGIASGAPVITATGDTSSAAIGAGAVHEFTPHLYVGTSSWLSCHVPFKHTDLRRNITSLPSGIPGRYWVATEQDIAGKALTWLIDNVLYPHDALDGDAGPPQDILTRLNTLAAQAPPGSRGLIFAPWLNGERTPVDDEHVRGGWFNMALHSDRAAMVRAVFEGVALNARWMLDGVEHFVHRAQPSGFTSIRFIGGGAESPLWCQIMADVLDREIAQVAEPRLANLRGAAFTASVALGECTWDDIPQRVAIAQRYQPDPRTRATYTQLYAAFTGLYKRTHRLYAQLNQEKTAWPRSTPSPALTASGSASTHR